MELKDALKKTWCIKLNMLVTLARACSTYQKEDGYIHKYFVKLEKLNQFFREISVPTLIDMFMCKTCCAVHYRYKELKQWELTWEQFLTEVTVIVDEEAKEGNYCPIPENGGKHAKESNKK